MVVAPRGVAQLQLLLLLLLAARRASTCSFAKSGMPPPNDVAHRRLFVLDPVTGEVVSTGAKYPVLPRPVSTANNAFVQDDLLQPLRGLTGNDRTLLENLGEFAAKQDDDLCYWARRPHSPHTHLEPASPVCDPQSTAVRNCFACFLFLRQAFQGLPPPRGQGPSLLHPFRKFWDVSGGELDQDIEWVQAYGDVAVSRLHSRVRQGGPVVGTMCAMGSVLMRRRCANGRARELKCIPAITDAEIQWPMAVSIWKVGHPQLSAAVTDWRANAQTGHMPNIEWVAHIPGSRRWLLKYLESGGSSEVSA